jgi:hypothetical protein
MSKKTPPIDLNLWLDRTCWEKQNQLKLNFWDILGNVSNSIPLDSFAQIQPTHKGKKLSRGNDLNGFPYQVLDLIRDFDLKYGLNIRVLNWFGNGLYIFVLIGKESHYSQKDFFVQNNYLLGLSSSPWSYSELIDFQLFTNKPTLDEIENLSFFQWFKKIEIETNLEDIQEKLTVEIKKILNSFLIS